MKSKIKSGGCVCPLCGNSEIVNIQKFQSKDCLNHLGIDSNNQNYQVIKNKIEILWNQSFSSFLKCNNCYLNFAFPFISGDSEFYNLVYDKGTNYPVWKWDFEITYKILSNMNVWNDSSDCTLLEIGAGDGSFIKRISDGLIISKNIVTTEYSEFGREKIKELGILSLPMKLTELLNEKYLESFDYICMFQVLEHLDNLDDVFNSLYKLMKKNAHLFISVPNNFHRIQFEKLGIAEDIPPIHISRWNIDSFKFVGQKYGLEIIDHQIQHSFYLSNALKYISLQYRKTKVSRYLREKGFGRVSKIVTLSMYTFLVIRNIKQIVSLSLNKNMGVSQWVHFKKV